MKKKWIASQIKDLLTSFPAENSRMKKKCFIALAACALVLLAEGCNNGFNDAALAAMQNNAAQEPVAVESVEIEPKTITLAPGMTRTLTATVLPSNATDKTVTWFSSNTSVVTVGDDGTVTAAGIGYATIYAQAGDKMAECRVNVRLPDVEGFVIDDYGTLTGYTGNDADVTIPDGVTSIGGSAFEGCTSLESVTIPDSVTYIGEYAFSGCASLASVDIPDGVTYIGRSAFYRCANLENVAIPDSVTYIGWSAFSGCASLESVTIPDGVTSIESGAFSGCASLACVTIPDGVTYIGRSAFYRCANLENVAIPDSVTYIGWSAFSGCASLASVEIPGSVTSIEDWAFEDCTSLTDVTYTGTLAQWCALNNDWALMFYAKHVTMSDGMDLRQATTLVIPDGVRSIGNDAFYGCTKLKEIQFNGTKAQWWQAIEGSSWLNVTCIFCTDGHIGVEEVPDYLTMSGTAVTGYADGLPANLVIPDGVTDIAWKSFSGCTSLASVAYGGTLAQWCAMYNDNCLMSYAKHVTVEGKDLKQAESIEIPDGVTRIGDNAFYDCESLKSVTIPDGVTRIGQYAFSGCTSLESVTIPASVTDIGWSAFNKCTSLASVTYGGTLAQWCAMDGVENFIYRVKHVTVEGKDLKQAESIEIPDGVTSIGESAFSGCTSLESVTIGNGVESIGYDAFSGCTSLASVTIPGSVTSIGYEAFSGCASLASVTIPDGVTSIGGEAFRYCKSLESVTIPGSVESIGSSAFYYCTSLENVTIPGSVTSIGGEAFSGCTSLESVTIGNGVESIRSRAFYGCTDLASVTYDSTKDDWRNIEKGSSIFSNTNVTEITDKDGVTFTVDEYGNITE